MTRFVISTDAATSARMKRVRQRDTEPELAIRKWLWHRGVRFRTNNRDLPGSPDLANRKLGWAVFVHGCFWHGHSMCRRFKVPKRNSEFWRDKIKKNKARDRAKLADLRKRGFRPVTVWECEVERLCSNKVSPPATTVLRLRPLLRQKCPVRADRLPI